MDCSATRCEDIVLEWLLLNYNVEMMPAIFIRFVLCYIATSKKTSTVLTRQKHIQLSSSQLLFLLCRTYTVQMLNVFIVLLIYAYTSYIPLIINCVTHNHVRKCQATQYQLAFKSTDAGWASLRPSS